MYEGAGHHQGTGCESCAQGPVPFSWFPPIAVCLSPRRVPRRDSSAGWQVLLAEQGSLCPGRLCSSAPVLMLCQQTRSGEHFSIEPSLAGGEALWIPRLGVNIPQNCLQLSWGCWQLSASCISAHRWASPIDFSSPLAQAPIAESTCKLLAGIRSSPTT